MTPGTRLGSYEVVSAIGAGGMGEVYRARDTKLDRDVALKILPGSFASDADRLMRFEREAKTLATLNHPNIAQIYGLEHADSVRALVLELVEGEDLAQRIGRGALPLDETLPIARQIAEALEAAHEAGVIHRDLKPANIKVKDDGTVKVLDFGLAKAVQGDGPGSRQTGPSPSVATMTSPALTEMGVILGTAAYMSPEQARGRPVDRRADIWAFGCVLYEMLTGHRAFSGGDVTEVLASVIKDTPSFDGLPAGTPSPIRRLLRRCLEKDPAQRLDSMRAARLELQDAARPDAEDVDGLSTETTVPDRRRLLPVAATAVIAAAAMLGATSLLWDRGPVTDPAPRRFVIPLAPGEYNTGCCGPHVGLSADGTTLFYRTHEAGNVVTGRADSLLVYTRRLDQFASQSLFGVDTGFILSASPDGRSVAFIPTGGLTGRPFQGLTRGDVETGSTQRLCDCPGIYDSTWSGDSRTIYMTYNGDLSRLPATGGTPELVAAAPDGRAYARVIQAPAGRAFVVAEAPARSITAGVTAGTLADDDYRLVWITPDGDTHSILTNATNPHVTSAGHLLFTRPSSNGLWAMEFDAASGIATGEPVLVVPDVAVDPFGHARYSVSDDGTLAYVPGGGGVTSDRVLVAIAPDGTIAPLDMPTGQYTAVSVAPSGRRVVVAERGADASTWTLIHLDRSTGTTYAVAASAPSDQVAWSPGNDSRLAFTQVVDGARAIVWQRLGTTAAPEVLLADATGATVEQFLADGRLVYSVATDGGNRDLWTIDPDTRETAPFIATAESELNFSASPRGDLVAYSTGSQVWLQDLRSAERVGVFTGTGIPRFSRDGRRLYVQTPFNIPVFDLADGSSPGVRPAGFLPSSLAVVGSEFDVDAAGNLVSVWPAGFDPVGNPGQINVVVNWFTELKAVMEGQQ